MILRFQKIVLQYKVINKTQLTKTQENSAQVFGGNYLTNHLAKNFSKIGLNSEELELFEYPLVITFL